MSKKSRFFFQVLFLILIAMAGATSVGYAEVKEIIAEGTYSMGDGETPTVAEERAMLAAKRIALEQAGTYVESSSETQNYKLTADEVKVIASGIVEVTVLDQRRTVVGDSISFWVKIKALITTDKIENMVAKIKESSETEDYKKLQDDYDRSQQEIVALKQQLQQANNSGDKKRIIGQIEISENAFQATRWLEQGNQSMADRKYDVAITAYSTAISLNPKFEKAYFRRGAARLNSGQYQAAIEDFKMAEGINPKLWMAYFGEGNASEKLGHRNEAVRAYRMFVELAPESQLRMIEVARKRIQQLQ